MFKKKILKQRDLAKEVYSYKNSLFQGFLLVPAPSPEAEVGPPPPHLYDPGNLQEVLVNIFVSSMPPT